MAIVLGIATEVLPSSAHADTGDQVHGAGTFGTWDHCPTNSTVTFDFSAANGRSGQNAAGTCMRRGQATVNGVVTTYRIDVDDSGEPRTSDRFAIVTASGHVARGTLGGGNIQIHDD